MQKRLKIELAVGIVFLTAILILGYYTVIMTQKIMEPPEAYQMTLLSPSSEGLMKTHKVKVNGVAAGSVKKIELMDDHVKVTLKMYKEFTLYDNYSIKIASSSVMGGKQVSIYPGCKIDKKDMEHEVVETRDNLRGYLDDPLSSISELINENRENIYVSIRNIREFTDKINQGKGTIGKLVNEDNVHSKTDNLVKEIREAVEDTREQAPITSFIRAALTVF